MNHMLVHWGTTVHNAHPGHDVHLGYGVIDPAEAIKNPNCVLFLRGLELLARKRSEVELLRVLDGGPRVASGRTPP